MISNQELASNFVRMAKHNYYIISSSYKTLKSLQKRRKTSRSTITSPKKQTYTIQKTVKTSIVTCQCLLFQ
nr:hypothetical protein CFP56_48288 [Quercus suber]